jgi:hypothetical protein
MVTSMHVDGWCSDSCHYQQLWLSPPAAAVMVRLDGRTVAPVVMFMAGGWQRTKGFFVVVKACW